MGDRFIGIEDDIGVERDKVDGLAYPEETREDIEEEDGPSPRLCGSEEEKNADDGEENGPKGGDYEDDGEDVMKGDVGGGVE